MHDHYEYKVYRRDEHDNDCECAMEWCLPTAEACRLHFINRFPNWRELRCEIINSCGYKGVASKGYGKLRFRHYPDTGWHVTQ